MSRAEKGQGWEYGDNGYQEDTGPVFLSEG